MSRLGRVRIGVFDRVSWLVAWVVRPVSGFLPGSASREGAFRLVGTLEAEQRGQAVGLLAKRSRSGEFEVVPERPQPVLVENGCGVLIDDLVITIGKNARGRLQPGDRDQAGR